MTTVGQSMADRWTVHAENDSWVVGRMDRAGKWYFVSKDSGRKRQVPLDQAVAHALRLWREGGTVHFGRYGGSAFDRRMRRLVDVQGKGDRVSKVDKWRRLLEQIALSKCVSTMLTGIDRYDDDEQRCGCVVHQARQLVASEAP